ncbi:MAG: Rrf2 family transcriptional regulator [candidate division Zixibacteria bacterium]|nr:Rrf2 family transcriptional regulator [candidate division Zixibacteria bacterium]
MIYPRQVVYSLEALSYLASLETRQTVKVKDLAKNLDIPRHYLGKVLTELEKKRLVTSSKGPSGGFTLAVNPSSITLYRILAALNGLEKLEDSCVMGLGRCNSDRPCVLHDLWTQFKDDTVLRTQKLTLEEFSLRLFGRKANGSRSS